MNGNGCEVNQLLSVDYTTFIADSEEKLQQLVEEIRKMDLAF